MGSGGGYFKRSFDMILTMNIRKINVSSLMGLFFLLKFNLDQMPSGQVSANIQQMSDRDNFNAFN